MYEKKTAEAARKNVIVETAFTLWLLQKLKLLSLSHSKYEETCLLQRSCMNSNVFLRIASLSKNRTQGYRPALFVTIPA